jgi:rsbT co-antagonist protein RsbR
MITSMNQSGEQPPELWLNEAEREAIKDFWTVYDAHFSEISNAVINSVSQKPELASLIKAVPPEKLEAQRKTARERMRHAFQNGEWGPYLQALRSEGEAYSQAGVSLTDWYELFATYRSHMLHLLFEAYRQEPDRLLAVIGAYSKFSDQIMAIVGQAYVDHKENIIYQQQEAILELSTPVLVLRDRLLLLPIIGLLDSHRAQQLTEHLLKAIREHRARVVVIDITGVLTVDSMVANHLIKTTEAARLMGVKVLVTGISTEIAQTLVRIGVDLSRLNTLGDLRSGLEEASRILGYELVRVAAEKTVIELEPDEQP